MSARKRRIVLDFSGKFAYHCHILSHEGFEMMAVEVVEWGPCALVYLLWSAEKLFGASN
jgi:hypothetical protein